MYRLTPRYHTYHKLEHGVFSRGADTHCLILSDTARSEYQEFYGTQDSRLTTLPPNLDADYRGMGTDDDNRKRVRSDLGVDKRRLLVLMVGSGFRTKGVDRAILAVASLPRDIQEKIMLFVAGEGKPGKFESLADTCGIGDQVHFLGGRKDVPDLLRAADLLVHPAYNENTGTVLLEAMAAGLPVLTTEVCGFAHHVKHAGAGVVLASPFSQAKLNQAFSDMLMRSRDEWSAGGAKHVNQPYFFEMCEKTVEAIERPIAGRRGPGWREQSYYLSADLKIAGDADPSFEDIMTLPGETFRRAPGRRTIRFENEGTGYFLKAHRGVGWTEILKNLLYLRLPVLGADNEWHALHVLGRAGIKVPDALGFGRRGGNPARRQSFVITREVEEAISLEDLVEQPDGSIDDLALRWALIHCVANIARTLHETGANHRDFYLCHFLVPRRLAKFRGQNEERIPVWLIDLHRVQLRRKTPMRWIIKDLGALYYSSMAVGLTRNDLFRFMKTYTGKSLRTTLSGSVDWDRVQKRAFRFLSVEHPVAGRERP